MLPQLQINPRPNRPKRPRPINPSDTAATTGLAVNPNGTYVANPYPTTAMAGMQGGFGAMLPAVNVSNLPLGTRMTGNGSFLGGNRFSPIANMNTSTYPAQTAMPSLNGLAPVGYGNNAPGYRPQTTPGYTNLTPSQAQSPVTGGGGFTPGRFSPQVMGTHIQNIANDPNYLNNLSPESRSAVLRMLGQQDTAAQTPTTGPGGRPLTAAEGGDTDFSQTRAAQYNAENNIPFLQQKRWDPQKKKYITVGQYLNQQKRQKKMSRRGGGGGGNQQSQARQNPQAQASYTLSSSFVNFGTATG